MTSDPLTVSIADPSQPVAEMLTELIRVPRRIEGGRQRLTMAGEKRSEA